jgi:hypothetical protein
VLQRKPSDCHISVVDDTPGYGYRETQVRILYMSYVKGRKYGTRK